MNAPSTEPTLPELTIGPPRRLTTAALLVQNFVLVVPLFVVILLMVSAVPLGTWTYIIPASGLVLSLVFLPFFQGNTQIIRLVSALAPGAGMGSGSFIVQLSLKPRVRSGFRAALEDADDVGFLRIESDRLVYRGDSIQFVLPRIHVREAHLENIGWRGLFLYKGHIRLVVSGLPNTSQLLLVDRSALLLTTSARVSRRLRETLRSA